MVNMVDLDTVLLEIQSLVESNIHDARTDPRGLHTEARRILRRAAWDIFLLGWSSATQSPTATVEEARDLFWSSFPETP